MNHPDVVESALHVRQLRGKPHSTASDAFSLGKTVEKIAADHGALGDETVAAIVTGLTETKVEDRWMLSRAIEMLPPSTPGKKISFLSPRNLHKR